MGEKTLHAVIYRSADGEDWVASCVEYDIATQGDSEEHALEMSKEAVELHFEDATPDIVEQVDMEVGSEPVIRSFKVSAPAILSPRRPVA